MKKLIIFVFILIASNLTGQNKINIYNPQANAEEDITKAVVQAKKQNKHVLIQVGGNWCPWCLKLHRLFESNATIDSTLNANYVITRVHYSRKDNINEDLLREFEFPQRFGFPVLLVLDQQGERIHTQNTVCLEEGKGYDTVKILEFLKNWSVQALDPNNYKK